MVGFIIVVVGGCGGESRGVNWAFVGAEHAQGGLVRGEVRVIIPLLEVTKEWWLG